MSVKVKKKSKVKRIVQHAVLHVMSTFNNTIVSLTDPEGNVLVWAGAGHVSGTGNAKFKGSRKSTPYAAQKIAEYITQRARVNHGVQKVDVLLKGPGIGKDSVIRTLRAQGIEIGNIKDITPEPHNGCRPKKRRRI